MPTITITPSVKQPNVLDVYTYGTFEALCNDLDAALGICAKEDLELLVPVARWNELYRADKNIAKMSAIFCCDFDRLTDAEITEVLDALEGLSYFVYTTHSHGTAKKDYLNCHRVIIELDREYAPEEHSSLWAAINDRVHGYLDPGARAPSQGYYLPGAANVGIYESLRVEGAPFQVPVHSSKASALEIAPATTTTTLAALEAALTTWARQGKDLERRGIATMAKALISGQNKVPIGQGQRNPFLAALAGYLAASFPNSEGLETLFSGIGWDLFNTDGKYPLSVFGDMIARFQDKERKAQSEVKEKEQKERQNKIRQYHGRDYEITPEEVTHIEAIYGENWPLHIIAIKDKDYFFLRPDGSYNPVPVLKDNIFVAARDHLTVFGDYIEFTYESDGETKKKPLQAFLEEYATVVNEVIFDMTKNIPWDAETHTIYFPAGRVQAEPVYHAEVEKWLSCFDSHLLDWLSVVTSFDEALPALILTGPQSCGKTILARGVGAIFGSHPLEGKLAFANFNAALFTKQPVVFADEKMPDGYHAQGTTWLRDFITQDARSLDEKYRSRVILKGFMRFIAAGNDLDLLNTDEDMNCDSREAYAQRIIHIDMEPGKAYLDELGREHIQKHWINGKHLAEHILWLKGRAIANPGRRFIVAGNHTKLHDSLAANSGGSRDVSYWLICYLADRNKEQFKGEPISFENGHLRVCSKAVVRNWLKYNNAKGSSPGASAIGHALRNLSKKTRQKLSYIDAGTKTTVNAWEIDPRLLRQENEVHGMIEDFDSLFKEE